LLVGKGRLHGEWRGVMFVLRTPLGDAGGGAPGVVRMRSNVRITNITAWPGRVGRLRGRGGVREKGGEKGGCVPA
jgi:hypothetical protein